MELEQLPADLLFHIFTFLEPNELLPLWRCSSKISQALNEERVWMFYVSLEYRSHQDFHLKRKEIESYIASNNLTWKVYYKEQSLWTWSSSRMRSPLIVLSNRDKTASRPEAGGKNPVVLASRPFSPRHNTISMKIEQLGAWVGVGFCDETFTLENSHVLGAQEGKMNSSLFQQKSTTLKVRWKDGTYKRIPLKGIIDAVVSGDEVTIFIDFERIEAAYYLNNVFLGAFDMKPVEELLVGGKIFPAVGISKDSVVTIVTPRTDLVMEQVTKRMEAMAM
mmetsp:Transcript_9062/g.12454  ORF Transcript_9062/g.12454 Transcript_9062/m.12454 type:complete len:278 (-) Transcript_9062:3-836(-)